jgi:hypothetical protein
MHHWFVVSRLLANAVPAAADGPITLQYNAYTEGSKIGTPQTLEVSAVWQLQQ